MEEISVRSRYSDLIFPSPGKALKVIQEVLSPGADLKFAPIFQRLGNWFRNPEMQIRVLLGALK